MNIHDFQKMKKDKTKISMSTCYTYWEAKILAKTNVDTLLVGDSLAMVVHGHDTTLPATVELMALHTAAVKRGAPNKFIVGDLPFLSYRKGLVTAMNSVESLMHAGASCVKLEGVDGHEKIIQQIVQSGVPVMGHIGLTPQSFHGLGGYKLQGQTEEQKSVLLEQAKKLESLGVFSIVLECVPNDIANKITSSLNIPTIGIGAGPGTDGQVLVLHDMLALQTDFKPKFVRQFMAGESAFVEALNSFDKAVKSSDFPGPKESYK